MSSHSEESKPIYKKWWFWVIIVVVILAIGGGASTQNNNNQQTSSTPTTQTETQTETATSSETTTSDNTEVTLSQYEQVKDGMTYDEVVAIFGGKENSSSESEVAGIKSEIKTWNGKKAFSIATIGFTDGKVSSKSQTGLE